MSFTNVNALGFLELRVGQQRRGDAHPSGSLDAGEFARLPFRFGLRTRGEIFADTLALIPTVKAIGDLARRVRELRNDEWLSLHVEIRQLD